MSSDQPLDSIAAQEPAAGTPSAVGSMIRLYRSMENMTVIYKRLAATESNFLETFKGYVDNGNKTTGRTGDSPYIGPYQIIHNDYIVFD